MLDNEEKIMEYWEKEKIPEKALKKGKEKWFFLDGPPYATGNIHMGTALNKILKDYFLRYKRMHGFKVWSQPGYDTHGLPTEIKVEKEMQIKNKSQIEDIGVEKFIKKCRDYATMHIDVMNQQFEDLGVWMDWENPYMTLRPEYIEGCWHTFKKGFDKGLLYEGKYPVHVCPHCETVVAYNEIIYEKKEDTSIYAKFKLKDKDEHLLIWTTTPWTLPSNTGVMVNPKFKYALVETMKGKIWIAKELVPTVMEKLEMGYTITKTIKGKAMDGWEYEHPMHLPLQENVQGRVVLSEKYVNLEAGTGLVHTAPGHGQEDYDVGKANDLQVINPVNMDGKYDETAGKYKGMFVKKADQEIINDLRETDHLVYAENFTHDYPLCWRCNTPLLFLTVPQLFFRVTQIREKLIKNNKKTNWTPSWAGKRFQNWLESLGDWPISRQRYWGTPVPLWKCECGKQKIVESLDELEIKDPHRPYIDEVTFDCECGKKMKRVPEVFDVWFDSGNAPWASLGYPKEKETFESLWPVDFVLEGSDQTRGWWNSLAICGVVTKDRVPFENVMQHGLVLDPQGRKMSKSKGTAISPKEVIEKHNRDVLRYFLLRYNPSEDLMFSWEKCGDVNKILFNISNCVRFAGLYCKEAEMPEKLKPEDEWILSKVNSLQKKVEKESDNFQNYKALEYIEEFILNDLSRWYIKLIRKRTWPTYQGEDKQAAYATLRHVIKRVLLMLAPATPFLAEKYNHQLFGNESIHLENWPSIGSIDEELEEQMEIIKNNTENCLRVRQEIGVKTRWPVKKITIKGNKKTGKAVERLVSILEETCNTKKIEFLEKDIPEEEIEIDEKDVIEEEALASEVIRKIQSMRKKQKLKVEDKIILFIHSDKKQELLEEIKPLVEKKVNAASYETNKKGENATELKFKDMTIHLAFTKQE